TATTDLYPLSLHDALPIWVPTSSPLRYHAAVRALAWKEVASHQSILINGLDDHVAAAAARLRRPYVLKIVGDTVWERARNAGVRSEEHTSELQSQSNLVCR